MTETQMTVADLIGRLAELEPDTPLWQAINPFFPMTHRLADVLDSAEPDGRATLYLVEKSESVQYGHLSRPVAEALTSSPPVGPPPRPPRRLRSVTT
ncbi:hypothetical protein EF912_02410 [Streptomyces sp. WAC07061]|uniref:hypothetical protein n=1 Tax=Streptomyces sp. WAC07061 TaxID=2487410 RepID=UPI000F7744AC|nr:hypothetical protein [Streptomyces sp. WAC07061]RSS64123.1 hypothetical protein EF912_02410 [Streptomyces sp. WAC07061]